MHVGDSLEEIPLFENAIPDDFSDGLSLPRVKASEKRDAAEAGGGGSATAAANT